jgi:hypothetical protein
VSGEITPLYEDKLFALSHPYELDGRATGHPLDERGYAPMQCYLLREEDRALLIGSGLTMHQEAVLTGLETLLDRQKLSFMPLGFDFANLCNARPIADRFGYEYVFQGPLVRAPHLWLNFRPEFPTDETDPLRAAEPFPMRTGAPIDHLDASGGRTLHLLVPGLRLLPNQWLYDEATKTLFTVDVFTWVKRDDANGPWVVTDEDDDDTTLETVENFLYNNRYWWLKGADTTRIRNSLAEVFERYEVTTIAPEYGSVLRGEKVVKRHVQLLDDLLASAPDQPEQSVEVGQWKFAGAR